MTFRFVLTTPKEKIIEKEVFLATLPGREGTIGILSGHSPMLIALQEGIISITDAGNQSSIETFSVGEGYAHITPESCVVVSKK